MSVMKKNNTMFRFSVAIRSTLISFEKKSRYSCHCWKSMTTPKERSLVVLKRLMVSMACSAAIWNSCRTQMVDAMVIRDTSHSQTCVALPSRASLSFRSRTRNSRDPSTDHRTNIR